jgi:small GTP-binding protein
MASPPVKVIFLGNSGIGKTCLINRMCKGTYEDQDLATVVTTFEPLQVLLPSNTTVQLHLWDTAGQETYLAIARAFFRGAQIAVICHAPSDGESLEKWAIRVRDVEPHCEIVAVLTQKDKFSDEEVNANAEAIQPFLERYNTQMLITSARTDDGIQYLIEELGKLGLEVSQRQTKVMTPSSIVKLEEGPETKEESRDCC